MNRSLHHTWQSAPGFSLVELMIVVGIIGILAALTSQNYAHFKARAMQAEGQTKVRELFLTAKTYYEDGNTIVTSSHMGPRRGSATCGQASPNDASMCQSILGFDPGPCTKLKFCYRLVASTNPGNTQDWFVQAWEAHTGTGPFQNRTIRPDCDTNDTNDLAYYQISAVTATDLVRNSRCPN